GGVSSAAAGVAAAARIARESLPLCRVARLDGRLLAQGARFGALCRSGRCIRRACMGESVTVGAVRVGHGRSPAQVEGSRKDGTSVSAEQGFLPFHRPSIDQEDIDAVVDTLRSGWLTMGPKTRAFEEAFASFIEAPHAVAVSSATAGLHLGLDALGIGPGDDV